MSLASAPVPPVFGPDDDAFETWRDDIVRRFEATGAGADRGWVAQQVLDFKRSHLGGDLGRWSPGDVEEILLELYPRTVVIELEDAPEVVAGFAGLAHFLAGEGVLEGGAASADRLVDCLRGLTRAFPRALGDESRWGMGKRLMMEMAAEGVDPTEPGALDRWMTSFNERPRSERDRVLGRAPVPPVSRARLPPMPPVVLAPGDELVAAAGRSVLVTRIRRFVDFVGGGRPVTDRGNLKLADGKALVGLLGTGDRVDETIRGTTFSTRSSADLTGVDLTFQLALATGIAAVERRRVVPGPDAGSAAGDADPRELTYRLLLGLLGAVGPVQHRYRGDRYGFGWYAEEVDRSLVATLLDLYRSGTALALDGVCDEMWELLLTEYDLEGVEGSKLDLHRRLVCGAVRYALDRLVDLGVVDVTGVEHVADTVTRSPEPRGGEVALRPLGIWAVQRLASTMTDAPVAGALVDHDAGGLLRATADLPGAVAHAEIDAWVDRHDDAAEQIVAALPDADLTARSLGFRALTTIGPAAADAVARLARYDDLEPWATVWRVQASVAERGEADCSGDRDRFIRLLAAALELRGAQALPAWLEPVAGASGAAAMLGECWRVRRPETEAVLAALGSVHPDRALAKAARKSLFRHRSSGGASG